MQDGDDRVGESDQSGARLGVPGGLAVWSAICSNTARAQVPLDGVTRVSRRRHRVRPSTYSAAVMAGRTVGRVAWALCPEERPPVPVVG